MQIGDRLRNLRKYYGLNQTEFGDKIGLKQTAIGQMENNTRSITDRTLMLLREKYNANEEWLINGNGEMIIEPDTFSLDEYANKKRLSALELDIIKCYMDLDDELRQTLMSHLKTVFNKHADTDEKETLAKQEEDKSHLTVIAAHNDAELTEEEVSLMREDLETLKNLRK